MWIIDKYCDETVDDPRRKKPKSAPAEVTPKEGLNPEGSQKATGETKNRNLIVKTQRKDNFAKDRTSKLPGIVKDRDVSSKTDKIHDNKGVNAGSTERALRRGNKVLSKGKKPIRHGHQEANLYPYLPIYSVGWFPEKPKRQYQDIKRPWDIFGFPRISTFEPRPVLCLDFSSNARNRSPTSNDFEDEEETDSHASLSPEWTAQDKMEAESCNSPARAERRKALASGNDRLTSKVSEDEDTQYEYSPSPSPPLNIGISVTEKRDSICYDSNKINYEDSPTPPSSPDFYEKYKDVIPVKRPDLERVRYLEFYSDSPWTKRDDFYPQLSPLTIDSTFVLIACNGMEPETAKQTLSNDDLPEHSVDTLPISDESDDKINEIISPSPQKENSNDEPLLGNQSPTQFVQHFPQIRSVGTNNERNSGLRNKLARSACIQALPNKPKISPDTKRNKTLSIAFSNKAKTDNITKENQTPVVPPNNPKIDNNIKSSQTRVALANMHKLDTGIKRKQSHVKALPSKPEKDTGIKKNQLHMKVLPNKPKIDNGTKRNQMPKTALPNIPKVDTGIKRNKKSIEVLPTNPEKETGTNRNKTPVIAIPTKPTISSGTKRNLKPNRLASRASLSVLPLLPNKTNIVDPTGTKRNKSKRTTLDQQVDNLQDYCQHPLRDIDGISTLKSKILVPTLEKRPSPIGVEQTDDPQIFSGMQQEERNFEQYIPTITSEKHLAGETNKAETDGQRTALKEDIYTDGGVSWQQDIKEVIFPLSSVAELSYGTSTPSAQYVNRIDSPLKTEVPVPPVFKTNPDSQKYRPSWNASSKVIKEWEECQKTEKSQLDHKLCSISPPLTRSKFSTYKPLPSISTCSVDKAERELIGNSPRSTSCNSLISLSGLGSKEVLPAIGKLSNESCYAEPRYTDEDDGLGTFYQRISSDGVFLYRSDGDGEAKVSTANGRLRNDKNLNSKDGRPTFSGSVLSSVSSVSLDSYMNSTTESSEYNDLNFCYFRIIPTLCNGQIVPPIDLSYIAKEEEMEAIKRQQRDPESYYLYSSSDSPSSVEDDQYPNWWKPKGRVIPNLQLREDVTDRTDDNTSTSVALSRMIDDNDELLPNNSSFQSYDTYTLTPDEWDFVYVNAGDRLKFPMQAQNGSKKQSENMDLRLDLGDLLSPSDSARNKSSTGSCRSQEIENEEKVEKPNLIEKIKRFIPCL